MKRIRKLPIARRSLPLPPKLVHRSLAEQLKTYAPRDGGFPLGLPGTFAIRFSHPSAHPMRGLLRPMLCLVAQGAKTLTLDEHVFDYDAGRMLIFSVELPVSGQVRRATPSEPYLCFRLDLDPLRIAELSLKVFPSGVPTPEELLGLHVTDVDPHIVDAAARLVALSSQPDEARLLGPLLVDEILIRLLRSPVGARVAQIGCGDSGLRSIAGAVAAIRDGFARPLRVEDLARLAHMSVSSFHQHFKDVTGMSPLQYQKALRLEEAKRLMLLEGTDVKVASSRVEHESPSQFTREYRRHFGAAPTRHITRLQSEGFAGSGRR